jgi:hypothetical protein
MNEMKMLSIEVFLINVCDNEEYFSLLLINNLQIALDIPHTTETYNRGAEFACILRGLPHFHRRNYFNQ